MLYIQKLWLNNTLNLNFLIKRKHIFKRRIKKQYIYSKNKYFSNGLYSTNKFKFEFIYLKVIKKLFRKKKLKKKLYYLKSKFWVMIKPNFLLTMKSKNSRMGSGVGLYTRVCSIIKPNKPILLLKRYSYKHIQNILKYFKLKLNINIYLIFLNYRVYYNV